MAQLQGNSKMAMLVLTVTRTLDQVEHLGWGTSRREGCGLQSGQEMPELKILCCLKSLGNLGSSPHNKTLGQTWPSCGH